MSVETPPAPHDADDHHDHPAWLAHHFDTPQQQFTSAKLGMWAFLLTEVLFFGGLFCAYAVYRRNYPEVFYDGHHFLNTTLGAINTVVLLFSSLTMALAVRCAQLNQRRGLITCLSITLACAGIFLFIKYNEYKVKWEHHMVPGQAKIEAALGVEGEHDAHSGELAPGQPAPRGFAPDEHGRHYIAEKLRHADQEKGLRPPSPEVYQAQLNQRIKMLGSFFGIYFCLTGLHAIHVICGIIAITWLLVRSIKRQFNEQYYDAVDCVGLYWHLVDLIWIYLFPLLYLIH
jgi:cytochrome c oxidase subunit 3